MLQKDNFFEGGIMGDKLNSIQVRFNEIESEMSRPEVASDQHRFKVLNQERSQLARIVLRYDECKKLKKELMSQRRKLKLMVLLIQLIFLVQK